ncbi:hypothetical protein VPH35_021875 [Triticum aestivum]|uniref:Uncharacterized protein n=1 Tax=Triticum aestivum TaxID=4565 RepID=A0A3B6B0N1_WHEAT
MGIHCNSRGRNQARSSATTSNDKGTDTQAGRNKIDRANHRCNYNFPYLYIYIRINNLRLPPHLQAWENMTTTSRWIRTPTYNKLLDNSGEQKDGKWSARHGGLETNTAATCTYHGSTDNIKNR